MILLNKVFNILLVLYLSITNNTNSKVNIIHIYKLQVDVHNYALSVVHKVRLDAFFFIKIVLSFRYSQQCFIILMAQ